MKLHFYGRLFVAITSVLLAATLRSAALDETQRGWVAKAGRHDKQGWVYLHLEGAPAERGFQHGFLLAKEINEALRITRASWQYDSAMPWSWLVEKTGTLITPKVDAENLEELGGIAEGLRTAACPVSRDELIAYNAIIELSGYWWPQELKSLKEGPAAPVRQSCSAFIATGHLTTDGQIVLGHNTMMSYYDALPNVVVDLAPQRGHRLLMQTCPGWIHSGTDFFVTDAGLIGAETTIGEFASFDTNGVPEFVRMRRATQDADGIDAWREIMTRGNNGGYANAWLLGDVNSGEIARLELGLKHVNFERKRDGFFVGSNVAEDLRILRFETDTHETDIRLSSVARRVRWHELMARHAGAISFDLAKRFEADHFDTFLKRIQPGGRTLCGHFELDAEPAGPWPGVPFGCSGTVDAKVVDSRMAKRLGFAARWGTACGRRFDAAKYLAAHPQFAWMRDLLKDRPAEPWCVFTAGEAR